MRHYTPEEKTAAMDRLVENRGNLTLTAYQLGIPVRTLRDWRQQRWLNGIVPLPQPPFPPPPTPSAGRENPQFENELEAITYMRQQIMDELITMAKQLHLDFAVATPYQRMILIPQLLDRLMKLDQHLKPYEHLLDDVEYVIKGAETFERSGTPDKDLEIQILQGNSAYGPCSLAGLKQAFEEASRFGDPPIIQMRFWVPANEDDDDSEFEIQWEGQLILST